MCEREREFVRERDKPQNLRQVDIELLDPSENPFAVHQVSTLNPRLDFSKVDILYSWYKTVNFGAEKCLASPGW